MNLAPASWIWFPSSRTLANTFVLFRRELTLDALPRRAAGWITADSRYRLTVNGARVQWGPAPCDPRCMDVDPVDLAPYLRLGRNIIGVEVLYYGVGEGAWVAGKPGLLCRFEAEHDDGRAEQIVSDERWQTFLDRAHRPGQYKRWFLRALQEEFDARLHPHGWDRPDFTPDERWLPAMRINAPADKPTSAGHYDDYLGSDTIDPLICTLRERSIPPLRETEAAPSRLADAGRVAWSRDPLDWFEFRTPGAFQIRHEAVAVERGDGVWELMATTKDQGPKTKEGDPSSLVLRPWSFVLGPSSTAAVYLTFEFAEQIVGWPHFTIDAPAGTTVELICQESHDPTRTAWLDNHFYVWSRFICRAGLNHCETFDFESLRWLQLHIRLPEAQADMSDGDLSISRSLDLPVSSVVVSNVGVRRRSFDWPNQPRIQCDEPALQRLFDAAINTLHNSAQETCVDGMGRERQQYSGDGGHQLQAVRYAFGEMRLPRRFLETFSMGQALDGYFLDSWPAYDRLARLMQRQIGATHWGPLLDHGVGFNFDCWNHYHETGDLDALSEPYPRLLRFAEYLARLQGADGLLPVERLGVPAVWIDHEAYIRQRHKQCAFNLYAAAMLQHALAPIARAIGDMSQADRYADLGLSIQHATIRRFWSDERSMFVNNLPWLAEEQAPRLCDRSLATAILFDQCPRGATAAGLRALAECPPELGISYPANAVWRYWALARLGRADVVLGELRARWATMASVIQNNTIQEFWHARPDTADQWSHCAVAPIALLFSDIAGIRAAVPGFARCQVRPQLGDLSRLELTAYTVRGPIHFRAERDGMGHQVELTLPPNCAGELLLPAGAQADLPKLAAQHRLGLQAFQLLTGTTSFFAPASP
jgi:alpha-L-rhamnosidase